MGRHRGGDICRTQGNDPQRLRVIEAQSANLDLKLANPGFESRLLGDAGGTDNAGIAFVGGAVIGLGSPRVENGQESDRREFSVSPVWKGSIL